MVGGYVHDRLPRTRRKKILITGAAGDIGSATVQLLLESGAQVLLTDISEAALEKAVAALPSQQEAPFVIVQKTLLPTLKLTPYSNGSRVNVMV